MPPRARKTRKRRAASRRRSTRPPEKRSRSRSSRRVKTKRIPWAQLARDFERELTRVWVQDAPVDWTTVPPIEIPGVRRFHRPTRQASARATPTLITAPTDRATLLISWQVTKKGRASPAFRTPPIQRTGRVEQMRSVVLPEKVPAHLIRDYILGLGRYQGRRRVQEVFGPEVSSGKVTLKDILAVVPRPTRGATASALTQYFKQRIAPALAERARRRSRTPGFLPDTSSGGSRGSSSKRSRKK